MANDVKVLKLITGEELLARVEKKNTISILDKPMRLMTITNEQTGEPRFVMIPWMRAAKNLIKSEKVTIPTESILVEDDPVEQIENDYLSVVTGLTL